MQLFYMWRLRYRLGGPNHLKPAMLETVYTAISWCDLNCGNLKVCQFFWHTFLSPHVENATAVTRKKIRCGAWLSGSFFRST